MYYSECVDIYEALAATTKRLEKKTILASFLKKLHKEGKSEWIYLLRGKVVSEHDPREFGISTQLTIKALSQAYGVSSNEVMHQFVKRGDFGDCAEFFAEKRKQKALFSQRLTMKKVFENLKAVMRIEGKGAIERKLALVAELLTSASGKEAKYLIRTLLNDLRVGVADALLLDALAAAFFNKNEEMRSLLEEKYALANDFAVLFEAAAAGRETVQKIDLVPGRPLHVMLAVKAESIAEAFRICEMPAVVEYKYDGFRMLIHKKAKEITLFTRRLENVTQQFPDVIDAVKKYVKGESYILDAEVVGYNAKTKKYLPFESISQRIKRKYEIEKLQKALPVEVNVFDILYLDGKKMMDLPFHERRKVLEKSVKEKSWMIRPAVQMIVHNEKEAERFYQQALQAGEEGIMFKKRDAPYKQGRRVGYLVKLKPVIHDLDLVIVEAEYGTGKRAGWLTSYTVACSSGKDFLEVGKVSSGLKEKKEEGISYGEITQLLKPLIIDETGNTIKVKPQMIVSVTYQNIQKSPTYRSGYALRFPRITAYRPDKSLQDVATLTDIEKEAMKQR